MKLWVLEVKEAHTEHARGKRHLFLWALAAVSYPLQSGMRVAKEAVWCVSPFSGEGRLLGVSREGASPSSLICFSP